MEIEVRIRFSADTPADVEAAARQAFLLLAAKLIEAVTRNGNNGPQRNPPPQS